MEIPNTYPADVQIGGAYGRGGPPPRQAGYPSDKQTATAAQDVVVAALAIGGTLVIGKKIADMLFGDPKVKEARLQKIESRLKASEERDEKMEEALKNVLEVSSKTNANFQKLMAQLETA